MAMSRRTFLRGAAAVGGAAGLAALSAACAPTASPSSGSGPAASTPDRSFKIAYLTLGWAGMEVIHQLGLLEEQGWKIEWQAVDVISGVVNAFSSGQVDLIERTHHVLELGHHHCSRAARKIQMHRQDELRRDVGHRRGIDAGARRQQPFPLQGEQQGGAFLCP